MQGSTRAYDSPVRRRRAAETRRAVIEAAGEEFARRGYSGTTLRHIAERAGVSIDSVRANGPKSFLLLEGFRLRYAGPGGWRSILEQESAQQVFDIEEPREAVDAAAAFVVEAHRSSARLWMVVRAAALTDDRVAEELAELLRLKEESFFYTTRWLVRVGVLPEPEDDVALRRLVTDLNLVMSSDTYLLLTEDYGLDEEQYRAWVVRGIRGCAP